MPGILSHLQKNVSTHMTGWLGASTQSWPTKLLIWNEWTNHCFAQAHFHLLYYLTLPAYILLYMHLYYFTDIYITLQKSILLCTYLPSLKVSNLLYSYLSYITVICLTLKVSNLLYSHLSYITFICLTSRASILHYRSLYLHACILLYKHLTNFASIYLTLQTSN